MDGATASDELLLDPYPDHVQAAIEARERFIRNLPLGDGFGLEFVVESLARWAPGKTLRVAFLEGPPSLHEQIARAASEWSEYGNIGFDFGFDPETGRYRSWSLTDATYQAEIRISFFTGMDHRRGYWSNLGQDSIDPTIAGPGEPSMNFGGYLTGIPQGGLATVIHEFGHALGFHHEHQHPVGGCELDFRWEDDPGYVPTRTPQGEYIPDASGRRPGLYTRLGGPPNGWPKAKVDFNLRQLRDTHAYTVGPFDAKSIMKYAFPSWMFREGEQSHCFSQRNLALSEQDKVGAATAYPDAPAAVAELTNQRRAVLESVAQAPVVSAETKQRAEIQLEGLEE